MDVVAPRVNSKGRRIEIPQDARGIGAQWNANGLGQDWLAVLGAEDKMNEIFGKRLRHGRILAPFQGAHELYYRNPGCYPGLSSAGAFSAGIRVNEKGTNPKVGIEFPEFRVWTAGNHGP